VGRTFILSVGVAAVLIGPGLVWMLLEERRLLAVSMCPAVHLALTEVVPREGIDRCR